MKKSMKLVTFTLVCLLMTVFSLAALAQATNTVPGTGPAVPAAPFDMTVMWNTLVVALVPIIVAGIKKVLPNIPKLAWPVGAAVLGVVSNWLLWKAGALPNSSWALGALCGAAGVGVREITDQTFSAAKLGFVRLTGGSPPAAK